MIPINDKIKAYVRAEKISQKVLATRAGIRPQVLSNICTGIRTPGKKIIARIVAATGG
ncbi:MAG: XRE family transcriptional regulator, partial [Deltaproteobacteria bacterium]